MQGEVVDCPRCGYSTTVPAADEARVDEARADEREYLPSEDRSITETRDSVPPLPVRQLAMAPQIEKFSPFEEENARRGEEDFDSTEPDDEPAGGFVLRSRRADEDEMDLTPMVDMTFLLLIFFMITASFSLQKTIEVPPPSPEQQGASQTLQTLDELEADAIIVRIDAKNGITVDDEPVIDRLRLAETLQSTMLKTQRTELVLTADAAAYHETIVAVIDAASEAGLQRIRLARPSAEGL
jgi:biopolymer transport protein ExbD